MPLDLIKTRMADAAPVKWLFAGDSITHGALHTMGSRDYTELFSERVRAELRRPRDCVIKTGVSGWRIGNIERDLDWSITQYRADVVSIAVGMNDSKDPSTDPSSVDEFRSAYLRVIDGVRKSSPATLFLLHTPPRILPLDENRYRHLPHYADAIRAVAEQSGALLIDHFDVWERLEIDERLQFFLSNTIHPNAYGHRLMAKCLLERLELWSPESNVGRLFMP